jgi:pyruvate/2-oxoglutarate dehydrogenase complex dihydrolipoamide acyltransferase (E2) component
MNRRSSILTYNNLASNGVSFREGIPKDKVAWAHDWVSKVILTHETYKYLLSRTEKRYLENLFDNIAKYHPGFQLPDGSNELDIRLLNNAKEYLKAAAARKKAAEEKKAAAQKAAAQKAAEEKKAAAQKAAERDRHAAQYKARLAMINASVQKAAEERKDASKVKHSTQKRCSRSDCRNYLKTNVPPTASLCKIHKPRKQPRKPIPKSCDCICNVCHRGYDDYQPGYGGWRCDCGPCPYPNHGV